MFQSVTFTVRIKLVSDDCW